MIDESHIANNWDKFESYRKNQIRGLLTGFKEMDKAIVGLPGLTTIMGEPKCLKSTFVMNIALNKAQENIPIILVDTENGLQRTRLRMLCHLAGITVTAIKSNRLVYDEEIRYNDAVNILKKLPIYYIESSTSSQEIKSIIKEVGQKHKKKILLIVDSLQSLISEFKDRRASIDYWVFFFNELKLVYQEWLTTILVSEKNRQSYGTSTKSGAKESGGIEYKSELVFDMRPDSGGAFIWVEAIFNRDGDVGIVSKLLKPDPYCYKLVEAEYVPE